MNIMTILVGLTTLVYIVLIFVMSAQWKSDKAYKRYMMFLITGALWVAAGTIEVSSLRLNISVNLFVSKLDFTFAAFLSYFIVLFAIQFPRQSRNFTIAKELLLSLPIVGISVITWLGKIFYYQNDLLMYNHNWYLLYFVVIVVYLLIITLAVLIKKLIRLQGIEKLQIKYILSGLLFAVTIGLVFSFLYAFWPALTNSNAFGIANICTLFFAFSCFYVLFRFRFMDIRVVVRRSLIYGISLLLTLVLYTYVALLIKDSLEKSWNVNPSWTAVMLIALVALSFPPLKMLVEKSINTLFKGRKSIDVAVKEVQDKMAQQKDFTTLLQIIAGEITKTIGVKEVYLYVLNHRDRQYVYETGDGDRRIIKQDNQLVQYFLQHRETVVLDEMPHLLERESDPSERDQLNKVEKEMKKLGASLVLPLKTEVETFCLVVLGRQAENKAYTVEDIDFLERLRDQVSSTLAYALLYSDAMARIQSNT